MNYILIYTSNITKVLKKASQIPQLNIEYLSPLILKLKNVKKENLKKLNNKKNLLNIFLLLDFNQCYKINKKYKFSKLGKQDFKKRLFFFLTLGRNCFSVKILKNFSNHIKCKIVLLYRLLNLILQLRNKLYLSLSKPTYDQIAFQVLKENIKYCISSRKFFENLDFYVFDDVDTIENDDAISFKKLVNGYEIYIAIVDLSEVWNIHMDKVALHFPQSLYTIHENFYMLPIHFIEILSLKEKNKRNCFLFRFLFNKDFEIIDEYFEPAVIEIKSNLSYETSNNFLNINDFILKLANSLLYKRISNGAIYFDINKGMKFVIQELMILVNNFVARILYKNSIKFISRNFILPANLSIYKGNVYKMSSKQNYILKYKILNLLNSAKYEIECKGHELLGLDKYTHVTSPIRRYVDLINQKQLISLYYTIDEFFSLNELKEIIKLINPNIQKYNLLVKNYNSKQQLIDYLSSLIKKEAKKICLHRIHWRCGTGIRYKTDSG